MDQQIRFCDAGAGRLAYAVAGQGPALVLPTWWMGHLELSWQHAPFRAFVEALAARHTVVRYDPLGTGLSQRTRAPEDFSLAVELEALERLIDHAELERCSLLGFSSGGPVAIAYAAAHAQRVSRLVLYGTYADGSRITAAATRDALLQMVREHWGLGPRVLTSVFLPESEAAERQWFGRLQREAAEPETAARLLGLVYELDVSDRLGDVQAPTLVLHRRGDRTIPYERGVEVAAGIPDARLHSLEGTLHFPWLGDPAALLEAMAQFLRLGSYPLAAAEPAAVEQVALSDREREVLELIAQGLGDREIAERLILSPHTVHRHVANVRTKLGQPSRSAAVAEAYRLGLI